MVCGESQPHRSHPQEPNTKLQWREAREPRATEVILGGQGTKTGRVEPGPHRAKRPKGNQKSEARVGDPRPKTQKGARGPPPRVRDPMGSGPRARKEQESETRVGDPRSEPKERKQGINTQVQGPKGDQGQGPSQPGPKSRDRASDRTRQYLVQSNGPRRGSGSAT